MTARLSPEEVIRVSLSSAAETTPARLELATSLVALGLKLAGYEIVPAGEAARATSVPKISLAEAQRRIDGKPSIDVPAPPELKIEPGGMVPEQPKRTDPIRFPFKCVVCNKIINDRAHANDCTNNRCPL